MHRVSLRLFVCCALSVTSLPIVGMASEPVVRWHTFAGSPAGDWGIDIAVDTNGNTYVTGTTGASWGTPINEYAGDYDIFLAKFNSSGVRQWNTFMGGPAWDEAGGVAVDASGSVYVSGSSTAGWGTPLNAYSGGGGDAFVAKFDSNGVRLWHTFLGGPGGDWGGWGVALDASGNVYATGASSASWGTPVNAHTTEWHDGFLAKLNSNGALQWNTFVGGPGDDWSIDVAVDSSGNAYTAGESDAAWGVPVDGYVGGLDGFVAKFDNSGACQWHTFVGSSSNDLSRGVAVDSDGDVYAVGSSRATWGAPIAGYAGIGDAYLAKFNSNGTRQWHTFVGSESYDGGCGISADSDGSIYLTGHSWGTWGTPIAGYAGGDDGFVAKFGSNGVLHWNTFIGCSSDEEGAGIAVGMSGAVYVTGQAQASWGMPVHPHTGSRDAFVVKLDDSGLPNIHYVSLSGSHVPPFLSWEDAATNIQAVVDAAASGDTVLLDTNHFVTRAQITIDKTIMLKGRTDDPRDVIVNGNADHRVFELISACTVAGITIANGSGGVYCHGPASVLTNCVVTGNRTRWGSGWGSGGGGVFGGTLNSCILSSNGVMRGVDSGGGACRSVLIGCYISDNWSDDGVGGGVAYCTLTNCTIAANWAYFGGGAVGSTLENCTLTGNSAVYHHGGGAADCVLRDCTLTDNSAAVEGGGAHWSTLTNCTITGNTAKDGGGTSWSRLESCTVSSNWADITGGGTYHGEMIACDLSENWAYFGGGAYSARLTNCAVFLNSAYFGGGGAYRGELANCTVARNSADYGGGLFESAVRNCIVYHNDAKESGGNWYCRSTTNISYSCTTPGPGGTGNITNAPVFMDPPYGDYRLHASSPCIDGGINEPWMAGALDSDGNPRVIDGDGNGTTLVDMGAHEYPGWLIDIRANGGSGPLSVSVGEEFVLTVEARAGVRAGMPVDWWGLADTPGGWYSYNVTNNAWNAGLTVAHQSPLANLPETEVLRSTDLPPGQYRFYLIIDAMDGSLNYPVDYLDSVTVVVVP